LGCFLLLRKNRPSVSSGSQNAAAYQKSLSDHLLPFVARLGQGEWIFMQDNASIHSKTSRDGWFQQHGIQFFQHPSRNPDMNQMKISGAFLLVQSMPLGKSINLLLSSKKPFNAAGSKFRKRSFGN
jgi:hypothetical protein